MGDSLTAMATSVYRQTATIPAGTAQASPIVVNIPVGTGTIEIIRWRVPPGPRGHMGWQLTMGGALVIPENVGTWIVADDEFDELYVSGLPDSGAWQGTGDNTCTYNHTIYLDFHITPISVQTTTTSDILTGFPMFDADIPTMWLS